VETRRTTRPDAVGVVGAGTIGRSVAIAFAAAGWSAVLVDSDAAVVEATSACIDEEVRMLRLLGKGEISADLRKDVRVTSELSALSSVRLIVENITEDVEAKLAVHMDIDTIIGPDAVVACNTSVIPIHVLAAAYAHPERVVGIHFMNPVAAARAAEVIPHSGTSDATLEAASAAVTALGQVPVIVRDLPGFVVNRILMAVINEAARLIDDGVAAGTIDQAFRSCLGHSMGPCETGDLIGLDTIVASLRMLQQFFPDRAAMFEPSPKLLSLVADGRRGRKDGGGFY